MFGGLFGRRRDEADLRRRLGDHQAREARLARQLAEHAQPLWRYPHMRGTLRELAARAGDRAARLAGALTPLGGELPAVGAPRDARTSWERLTLDLDELAAAVDRYLDDAYAVEREHPEVADLLLRLHAEATADHRDLLRMLKLAERDMLDRPDEARPEAVAERPVPDLVPYTAEMYGPA